MLKRNWALMAFVYLALAEVLSLTPVPDLSLCLVQPEHDQQAANHDDKKHCPAFHTGAALVFEKVDFFLEHHDKSVVGGFTIVLAVSTIGLWLATNKLWAAGEKQFGLLAATAEAQSRETQDSIRAATDAVQNGINANQIAVTNAEQQLRAYVTAKGGDLNVRRRPSTMGAYGEVPGRVQEYSMAPILFNGGQTPATNVVVNASTQHFASALPSNFAFPDSDNFGYGVIGPQSELFGPAAEVPAADIDPLVVGGFWYMWGWVEYDDIFSGTFRHRTEFCFEINREILPSGQLWLGFRPTDRFNAVDLGCLRVFNPNTNKYG